ncbi:MAG: DUF72 domain-containing protein [Anaerolineales bacterium]|nr:DUF72 domain-containing protein [Anaerolineales bacterium]
MNDSVKKGELLLGTQGFSFDDWVGPFYPDGTPKREYLEVYSKHFRTVEIDSTFYGVPRLTTVEGWRKRTPPEFRFAAKFPRAITHEKMLVDAERETETFIRVMEELEEKLGVLTLQFSYEFESKFFDRLDAYLGSLPPEHRYAVEVRNRDWMNPEFGLMLREHNIGLVLQDLYYMPRLDWITADFTVIRWLGRRKDIEVFDRIQIDRTERLKEWTDRVWLFINEGIDIYGYFNNHFAGHSPASVRQFAEMIGEPIPWPSETTADGSAADSAAGGAQLEMDIDKED